MCIICKASFAKHKLLGKCFFFFNQTYLIYLFLFIYYDVCCSNRYYFHTTLDQILYEVCAVWCILAMNHVEIKFRERKVEEFP